MDFSAILLNGFFGLVFAVIGYAAIIRGAQIQADAERQKNANAVNKRHESTLKPDETRQTVFERKSTDIHWTWWAWYLGMVFVILVYSYMWEFSTPDYIFMSMLVFFMIIVPIITLRQAIVHPLSWQIALAFIASLHLAIFMFALTAQPDLYVDLYEDVPLWAVAFGNISAVVIVSLRKQQIS